MKLKAVDIVLIPSEDIINLAITLNQRLTAPEIQLNRINAIPHISLAMAVIEEKDQSKICQKLNQLKQQTINLKLEIDHVFHNKVGKLVTGIGFKRSTSLMQLHQAAVEILKTYAQKTDVENTKIFANGDLINYPQPAKWVTDYFTDHAYSNFDPHITIGYGDIGKIEKQEFSSQELTLYHLGPYCTCHTKIRAAN